MTNAEGLRALATVFETDETAPYKAMRQADPDGLAIQLLRQSADEMDRLTAWAIGREEELTSQIELYRSRWLSCVTQEEAQRLRDEIERLRAPTRDVTPASNVLVGDRTIEAIVADLAEAAAFLDENDPFDVRNGLAKLCRQAAELIEELAPSPAEQAQREEDGSHTADVAAAGEGITDEQVEAAAKAICKHRCVNGEDWLIFWRQRDLRFAMYEDARAVLLSLRGALLSPAEFNQRRANMQAWKRNKDIRLGTDRGPAYESNGGKT